VSSVRKIKGTRHFAKFNRADYKPGTKGFFGVCQYVEGHKTYQPATALYTLVLVRPNMGEQRIPLCARCRSSWCGPTWANNGSRFAPGAPNGMQKDAGSSCPAERI